MIRGLLIALAVGIAVWLLGILILVIVGRKQQALDSRRRSRTSSSCSEAYCATHGFSRLEDLARHRGDLDRLSDRPRAGVHPRAGARRRSDRRGLGPAPRP